MTSLLSLHVTSAANPDMEAALFCTSDSEETLTNNGLLARGSIFSDAPVKSDSKFCSCTSCVGFSGIALSVSLQIN